MAATERAHSDAINTWAALRERPSPALMRESPAEARGTRKMKRRQIAAGSVILEPAMLYLLSSLDVKCERMTRVKPKTWTAAPASTKLPRCVADARSTIEASTRSHPDSKSKNPRNFIASTPNRNRSSPGDYTRAKVSQPQVYSSQSSARAAQGGFLSSYFQIVSIIFSGLALEPYV